MSSALKPVLTASGPQNSSVPPQINKPMHPQGAPATYGQPTAHMPQNLVNMQHGLPSPAHNPVNVPNHYLNVSNTVQHYNVPVSNHPVPNISQPTSYNTSPPKNPMFPSNFQPNLGHPPQNISSAPPQQASTPAEPEKPHSNGTPEVQTSQTEQNHVPAIQTETVNTPASPEKPKQSPEKPPTPVSSLTDESSNETKQQEENPPDVNDSSSSASIDNYGMEITTSNSSTAENKTEEADVPTESPNESEVKSKINAEETKTEAIVTPAPVEGVTVAVKEQVTPKSTTKPSAPRTPSRKTKTPKVDTSDSPKTSKPEKSLQQKSPSSVKRARTKTQPYQSPLPELEIISKMTSSHTPRKRDADEKLIIFYNKEFLAVRNPEGGFYVCQTVQNIYKNSSKIKIRWLSSDKEDKSGEIYTPDFYDVVDFDCILTNLDMSKVDKGKFKLPAKEQARTGSILKRALAVEKGETVPSSPTEDNPDGLDLSLYKEESQLQKRRGKKRRSTSPLKSEKSPSKKAKKSAETPKAKKLATPKKPASTPTTKPENKKTPTPSTSATRSERAKRRQDPIAGSTKAATPASKAKKAKTTPPEVIAKKTPKIEAKVTPKTSSVKKETKAVVPAKPAKTPAKKQKEGPTATPQRKTKRTRK